MVALAIATHTTPSAWAAETDEAIATALQLLEDQAREIRDGR